MFSGKALMAIGIWLVGIAKPLFIGASASANRAKYHWLLVAADTSTVMVMVWESPSAKEKLSGRTEPVTFTGKSIRFASQTRDIPDRLVTVRVQLQVTRQRELPRLARLRVLGSPPKAGLAAVKSALSMCIVRPTVGDEPKSTRPAPRSNGSLGVVPSSL